MRFYCSARKFTQADAEGSPLLLGKGYLYGKTVNTSAAITGADKVKSSVFSKMREFTIPIRYAIIEWNAAENTVLKDIQQFEQRCSSFKMV